MRNGSTRLFVAVLLVSSIFVVGQSAEQKPVQRKIKTVYVIPSSHWDLGFIAPPEQILPRLKPHIDEVIADCKADPEFRWTIESVWQLREWLARTNDPKQISDLVALISKGQIQVSAVWGSMHTEFMGSEQLNRLVYDMKDIEQQYGIRSEFAMMDDVPGFTSRLPQVLARSGVKYFVNGSNLFLFGGTSLSPGKVPFYWQSADGSKVLMWQTQSKLGGYTEAMADYYLDALSLEPYTKEHFYPKEWEGLSQMEIMQRGMDKLLKKYEDAGYPHDAIMLLYLHDFIPPSLEMEHLLPSIRAWNAAGKQPRIVVATPAEFFRHLETQNAEFPTYAGDWSGLWSEVKTNSPKISAQARWSQDHLSAAEILWTLLTFREGTNFPAGNFDSVHQNLMKYEEHSGAAQVGWPKLMSREETEAQNSQYVAYTKSAGDDVHNAIATGMRTLFAQSFEAKAAENVVVFNPLSWSRSGEVSVSTTFEGLRTVRDLQTNKLIPSRQEGSKITFLAGMIPGVGYRTFALEPQTGSAPKPVMAKDVDKDVASLENEYYRVAVREKDGTIVSLLDKQLGRDLLNPASTLKLNSLERWHWAASLPVALGSVKIARNDTALGLQLVITRPGSMWPRTTITLPNYAKILEISNTLDRDKMPFVASLQPSEYYSFAFPFAFSGSAEVWVENGAGFHRIPEDYLDGARTDAVASQHALALSGMNSGKKTTVVLAHRQAFFSYLPGMPGTKGKSQFLNTVKSIAIRKQDQGDTRGQGMVNFQELEPRMDETPLQLDYAITSGSGEVDLGSVYRTGLDLNVPLIAEVMSPHSAPASPSGSFISIDSPDVALLTFKPSADGDPTHYTVRLQEIAGRPVEANLTSILPWTKAEVTDMTERNVLNDLTLPLRVSLLPNETKTIRLTIPHSTKSRSSRWWEW